MLEAFVWFILGMSAIFITVGLLAATYIIAKFVAFLVFTVLFLIAEARNKSQPLGVQFTPEQWAAWNARSERVRDDQIRRKQLYLLPPPSTSP